ncbi:MAG: hypothetical protein M0Z93_00370 [Actinomycetota bacterium]|jgi:hypothetical protein|nr:hypothetical protein [Actinomycetota bacterium]
MSVLSTTRRRVAAGAIALTVAVGGGAAAVVTSWPSATAVPTALPVTALATNGQTSPPGASTIHHRRATIRAILARTDHAVFTVKLKGGWVTLTFDRGTVTAISPTAVTVQRPDGGVATLAINSTTKIGGKHPATAIPTGSRVVVLSENGVALRIVEMKPRTPAGLSAPVDPSTPVAAA